MKKLLSLIAVAAMFAFVACGPSAEEKAAQEKAIQDSLAQVEAQRVQDSIAAEQAKQDSIAAAEQQRIQDSIAAAEAAKPKKGKKQSFFEAKKIEKRKF